MAKATGASINILIHDLHSGKGKKMISIYTAVKKLPCC